ncbi:MAG: hypothetical protein KF752_05195 [Pirellulaceae bacterium]|nr:hypothetical protein [Pirellulaceae bacterium]
MANNPQEFNPYAPTAMVSGVTADFGIAGVDGIRREHLSHEASVKSIGVLYLLGSIAGVVMAGFYMLAGLGLIVDPGSDGSDAIGAIFVAVLGLFVGGLSVLQFFVGLGLRRLVPWTRIGGIVISAIGLLGFPIGTLISAYFLYLLASRKGVYIFTPKYAQVIASTPHIRYKTSIIVWILLGLLILAVVGLVGVAVLGSAR